MLVQIWYTSARQLVCEFCKAERDFPYDGVYIYDMYWQIFQVVLISPLNKRFSRLRICSILHNLSPAFFI